MAIRTLIVDDDEMIRNSLKILLGNDKDICVAGDCKNGDEAYKKTLSDLDIQVILMDIQMPVCNGILATKNILGVNPRIKIIALTTFDDDEYIQNILKSGAKGYLLKIASPEQIIESIKVVNSGSMLLHPDVALKLPGMLKSEKSMLVDTVLSYTEKAIVKLISKGYNNREISNCVHLSEGTVKNRISKILNKLGFRDRTQIAVHFLNKENSF